MCAPVAGGPIQATGVTTGTSCPAPETPALTATATSAAHAIREPGTGAAAATCSATSDHAGHIALFTGDHAGHTTLFTGPTAAFASAAGPEELSSDTDKDRAPATSAAYGDAAALCGKMFYAGASCAGKGRRCKTNIHAMQCGFCAIRLCTASSPAASHARDEETPCIIARQRGTCDAEGRATGPGEN